MLTGTGLANSRGALHLSDGGAIATTVTTNAQGTWSFTPSGLSDGAHTIVASQTDSFGNTGTASLSFTLDTTAPSVSVPMLAAASYFRDVAYRRHHRRQVAEKKKKKKKERGGWRYGAVVRPAAPR